MPASSNSPLAREEDCEGTVQFWLSYKLTTPRRNIFKIDLASRSGAGRSRRPLQAGAKRIHPGGRPRPAAIIVAAVTGRLAITWTCRRVRFYSERTWPTLFSQCSSN